MRRPLVRIERERDGDGFVLRLPPEERELLRTLPEHLRELMSGAADGSFGEDPALNRLFPPAYGPDDADRNADYRRLVHDDLLRSRLEAVQIVLDTVDRERLVEDEVVAWLGVLNDLRLVIGTRIGVTDDPEEPDPSPEDPGFNDYVLYRYLTLLQGLTLEALTGEEIW